MSTLDTIAGVGRGLLRAVLVCVTVVITAVAAMAGIAAESLSVAVALVAPLVAVALLGFGSRALGWRSALARRRLRRRVGDPLTLTGDWRRLLADAWRARDEFSVAVDSYAGSPVGERLAGHQVLVDAALEHCGDLARSGHRLLLQLKGFHPRRLRRDLLLERRRDRNGARATALARQLDDVAHLRDEVARLQLRLEHHVHDLRTAAWRAATLRTATVADGVAGTGTASEAAVTELLEDLEHLEAALTEVDEPSSPRPATLS